MRTDFLDQVPSGKLSESEGEAISLVRSVLERLSPSKLDIESAGLFLRTVRSPLKTRYIEIVLPHVEVPEATLTISWNDRDYIVETPYGIFEWGGDEESLFERFLAAAIEGTIEYETIYKDNGRPKRARAWSVDVKPPELLGQMYSGLGRHAGWDRATRTRPASFV